MAMMLSKTYEAFRAAGAPDDKAREAAEEIAGFKNRLATIEADMKLLKWMLGSTWRSPWRSWSFFYGRSRLDS